jgi:hypothetical protein
MSELPIPPSPNGSTASFPSNLEDTTDTLGPRSFPFDDQFVSNAPLYTNDSNGPRWNDSNALVSDPLLYENLSLPFAIDMHPPIEPQTQRTDQIPPFPATTGSSIGLQDAYQEYEFLSENVLSEWAPGVDGPIDTYCPTQLAVDDQCPASDHTKAAVTSNGPTDPAQKTRKRFVLRPQLCSIRLIELGLMLGAYVDRPTMQRASAVTGQVVTGASLSIACKTFDATENVFTNRLAPMSVPLTDVINHIIGRTIFRSIFANTIGKQRMPMTVPEGLDERTGRSDLHYGFI